MYMYYICRIHSVYLNGHFHVRLDSHYILYLGYILYTSMRLFALHTAEHILYTSKIISISMLAPDLCFGGSAA